MKDLFSKRILPGLMIVAALTFGVRFSDMIRELSSSRSAYAAPSSEAQRLGGMEPAAGEGDDKATPPSQDDLKKADGAEAGKKPVIESPSMAPLAGAEKKDEAKDTAPGAKAEPADEAVEWKGADDLDDEYADVKMEMFSDLSKRRKDLEGKERELVMREALLKAAQAELAQKTDELLNIKKDIESLLAQQTEQENERIASLVKIYEGMKAKDAAKIFNSLDMDVLMQVMTKMSERKSAPILAAMDEDKARSVTILLAEQNKLPSIPQLPLQQ